MLGKAKHSKLFPLVAIKCMRANGPSGNLLFAGAKTGQAERDFFAHGLCTQLTRKVPTAAQPALRAFEKYSKYPLALGLSEFASLDEDGCDLSGGCEELGATFPWALHLHPRVASPPLPDGAPNTAFVDAPGDDRAGDRALRRLRGGVAGRRRGQGRARRAHRPRRRDVGGDPVAGWVAHRLAPRPEDNGDSRRGASMASECFAHRSSATRRKKTTTRCGQNGLRTSRSP